MSDISEFYSDNLSAEVLKGSTEKARRGGTPFRAQIGYRNVREVIEGREIRTIAIDPVRGPLITEAFRRYASGSFPLIDLAAFMEAKGLRSPATPKVSARAFGGNRLSRLLGNRFYTGIVTYRGESHPGRHDPRIDEATFEEVQELVAAKRTSGERPSRRQHYLRGSLVCGRCGSSLIYSRNKGNGGLYEYFICMGQKRGECNLPHQRAEAIAAAIERLYGWVQLSARSRQVIAKGKHGYLGIAHAAIVEVAKTNETDGTRMVAAMTSRKLGRPVNRKRVQRVRGEQNLLQRHKPSPRRRRPGFFRVECPNQLWHMDMAVTWGSD
ncbi:MAG: recombinase family protein [Solirubrobacterales bacterium]